jgi:imidazolonepropionase-like amidohydrolase
VRNGTWQVPTLVQKRAWGKLGDPKFVADPRLKTLPTQVRAIWKVEKTPRGVRILGDELTAADLKAHAAQFRRDLKLVLAMHKAGVRILAGTDTPSPYVFPGSGLHDELALLVRAGLSPLEALQAATRGPAEFLGRQKKLGTVERGKIADLVLLHADPLKDVANTRRIAAVILEGRVIDTPALRALRVSGKR